MGKTRLRDYFFKSSRREEQLQDRIRERVLQRESELEDQRKKKEIQDINLSVLEEMTDILSREEILKIADEVRAEVKNENEIKKSGNSKKFKRKNLKGLISLLITAVICIAVLLLIEEKEARLMLMVLGFPLPFIIFGLIYSLFSFTNNE